MNRGKSGFQKNFDLEDFRSESFSICTSCIESSRFRALVAKGRATFRDRITGEKQLCSESGTDVSLNWN